MIKDSPEGIVSGFDVFSYGCLADARCIDILPLSGGLRTSARQRGTPVSPPAGPTTSPFLCAMLWNNMDKLILLLVTPKFYSPRIWSTTLLVRGPSNSQKKTACHVPSCKDLSLSRICSLQPTRELLQCESELPSQCR